MKRATPSQRQICEACGKRRFTRKDAIKAARHQNHQQARDWPVGPYPCPEGGVWFHVGHVPSGSRASGGRRGR